MASLNPIFKKPHPAAAYINSNLVPLSKLPRYEKPARSDIPLSTDDEKFISEVIEQVKRLELSEKYRILVGVLQYFRKESQGDAAEKILAPVITSLAEQM